MPHRPSERTVRKCESEGPAGGPTPTIAGPDGLPSDLWGPKLSGPASEQCFLHFGLARPTFGFHRPPGSARPNCRHSGPNFEPGCTKFRYCSGPQRNSPVALRICSAIIRFCAFSPGKRCNVGAPQLRWARLSSGSAWSNCGESGPSVWAASASGGFAGGTSEMLGRSPGRCPRTPGPVAQVADGSARPSLAFGRASNLHRNQLEASMAAHPNLGFACLQRGPAECRSGTFELRTARLHFRGTDRTLDRHLGVRNSSRSVRTSGPVMRTSACPPKLRVWPSGHRDSGSELRTARPERRTCTSELRTGPP